MPFIDSYAATAPLLLEIQSLQGLVLLEFGAAWCGYCQIAQPLIQRALNAHPEIHHIKLEDGKGKSIGRAFDVKLWPTLVLLRDGAELGRQTRPRDQRVVDMLLQQGER